jgi:hypothetical protein
MKKVFSLLAIVVILFAAPGCMKKGYVSVDAVSPNWLIVKERHDAYVNTGKAPDGTELKDYQKETQLRSTRLIQKAFDAAKK